jgi:subtilisin family serine protease
MKYVTCLLILVCSLSVAATDDYFYSLGQIRFLQLKPGLVLMEIASPGINAVLADPHGVETIPLPAGFERLAGSYRLARIDRNIHDSYDKLPGILPVYTDSSGTLVVPRNEMIVRFIPGILPEDIESLTAKYNLGSVRTEYPLPGTALIHVKPGQPGTVFRLARELYHEPAVQWAVPNFISQIHRRSLVNDPLFGFQWHLTNDGHLATAVAGADARVGDAWATTMGTGAVRICVFDDSVEKDHEDLAENFVSGLNLDDWGPDPSPRVFTGSEAEEHGTACAGVAVSRGNNGIGCSGAAPYCSLMGIRWGAADDAKTAAAFYWARTNGADIISCSWGVYMTDTLFDAIRDAARNGRDGKGCIVLFAAGNNNAPISVWDPSRHPDVICVSASNCKDQRASYSSYGSSVSITAPSDDMNKGLLGITTTDDTGAHGYSPDNYCHAENSTGFGGTSSATPLAAGVAALCLSVNSNLTAANVKALLQETADKIDSGNYPYSDGWNQYLGYGRINAARAVVTAPGYTNTPPVKKLTFNGAKGKINLVKKKFKAKLNLVEPPPVAFNGIAAVSLDGQPIAVFDGSTSRWIWNRKGTKGKNKNPAGDLFKMGGKPGKYFVIIKAANLQISSVDPNPSLRVDLETEGQGEITLNLDAKGKFKQ